MLLPKKISNVKKISFIVTIAIILGIIGYLISDNFLSGGNEINPLEVKVEVLKVPDIDPEIESSFLLQEPYTSLRQYGNLPVEAKNVGRTNPFRVIPFMILN
jgi:hypothetical protein